MTWATRMLHRWPMASWAAWSSVPPSTQSCEASIVTHRHLECGFEAGDADQNLTHSDHHSSCES